MRLDMEGDEVAPSFSCAPPVLRRVALFMDGMARAMILPFGPMLVHRLVDIDTKEESNPHSQVVAVAFAWVVAIYIIGRWLGCTLAGSMTLNSAHLPRLVARLTGAALSLHVFTYGAGLASVQWLIVIRFLSACLVGFLSGMTSSIRLPEDDWIYSDSRSKHVKLEEQGSIAARREALLDIASGTAKIYLTGFAVSMLTGGLLFRKATKDSTFQALTGAYKYSWSPLFLVSVAAGVEIMLRGVFALAQSTTVMEESAGPASKVRRVLRQLVRDEQSSTVGPSSTDSQPCQDKIQFSIAESGSSDVGESEDDDAFLETIRRVDSRHHFSPVGRGRLNTAESYTTLDDFYDCRSVLSDMENVSLLFASLPASVEAICEYSDGQCLYPDGSSAYVPHGDCCGKIPQNYLAFYNQNQARAAKAWEATQQWRCAQQVWTIHRLPNPWFAKIKEAYPHFVHGHSKAGYPIIYEQPGRMNLKGLFRNGCEISDMVKHYVFFLEFISNRICIRSDIRSKLSDDAPPYSSSSWGTMVVMDVKGAGISHLSGDVVRYLKQAGEINSNHYPMSMKRAFVVNSPFWLAGAWSGLKGILPDSVQVDILSESRYLAALREYIDDDQIPSEYGGSSPFPLGEHPYELELRSLVDEASDSSDGDLENNFCQPPVFATAPPDANSRPVSPLPFSPDELKSPARSAPLRRRIVSSDHLFKFSTSSVGLEAVQKDDRSDGDVFRIASTLLVGWSAVQGGLEVAMPLWILSATKVGGLGYGPSRSGVSIFCASLALLWVMRKKHSRLVSQIPIAAPMRAFRIGAGSESCLLAMLAFVSSSVAPERRTDSVFVMASVIIMFSCLALASMLGRSASKILHRVAADSFSRHRRSHPVAYAFKFYSSSSLLSDCASGRFTDLLSIAGELSGIFFVAPIWWFCMSKGRPAPFDSTCIIIGTSLMTFVLYVSSFALHLDKSGEFSCHTRNSCAGLRARRCVSFFCEIVAVSAGDMASLFEEANWSCSPLLSPLTPARSRVFSDARGHALDLMEQGQPPTDGRRKAH